MIRLTDCRDISILVQHVNIEINVNIILVSESYTELLVRDVGMSKWEMSSIYRSPEYLTCM